MDNITVKKINDSLTEQVQIVLYSHTSGTGRLFGGQLMQWVDVVSGVVGRRHSGCEVTTAAIDNLSFLSPVYVGDTVVLKGRILSVGNTSMKVRVDTYKESKAMERTLVNKATLVMVALDGRGRPCKVPALETAAEEE